MARPKSKRRGLHGVGESNSLSAKFKRAISKPVLKESAWALLAPLTWIIPASIFNLSGWGGFFTSFAFTWGLGVALDKKALQTAAFATGAVQLMYVYGTAQLQKISITPWRMGNYDLVPATAAATQTKSGFGFGAYMDANDRIISLPNASEIHSRPGELSSYVSPDGSLKGYNSADGTLLSENVGAEFLTNGGNAPFRGAYAKPLAHQKAQGFRMSSSPFAGM